MDEGIASSRPQSLTPGALSLNGSAPVGEVLALIPAEVVQEVVKRERKLAELRAAEEAAAAAKRRAAEAAAAPPAPEPDVSAAS